MTDQGQQGNQDQRRNTPAEQTGQQRSGQNRNRSNRNRNRGGRGQGESQPRRDAEGGYFRDSSSERQGDVRSGQQDRPQGSQNKRPNQRRNQQNKQGRPDQENREHNQARSGGADGSQQQENRNRNKNRNRNRNRRPQQDETVAAVTAEASATEKHDVRANTDELRDGGRPRDAQANRAERSGQQREQRVQRDQREQREPRAKKKLNVNQKPRAKKIVLDHLLKPEETAEDIRLDNLVIEKEIELEIAEIKAISLGFD